MPKFRGSFAENGHHRATQSPGVCPLSAWDTTHDGCMRGGVLVRRLGC
jgi:hypothetical protein